LDHSLPASWHTKTVKALKKIMLDFHEQDNHCSSMDCAHRRTLLLDGIDDNDSPVNTSLIFPNVDAT
jgi:hypothetical protein